MQISIFVRLFFILSYNSLELCIIVYRDTGAPGHGKDVVDGLNEIGVMVI